MTVADQRVTQRLLQAALTVLKGLYDKKPADALMQKQEPVGPLPPPGFNEYTRTVVVKEGPDGVSDNSKETRRALMPLVHL